MTTAWPSTWSLMAPTPPWDWKARTRLIVRSCGRPGHPTSFALRISTSIWSTPSVSGGTALYHPANTCSLNRHRPRAAPSLKSPLQPILSETPGTSPGAFYFTPNQGAPHAPSSTHLAHHREGRQGDLARASSHHGRI